MEDKYDLHGKIVELQLNNNKEYVGIVEYHSPKITVLKTDRGILIAYREQISAALILDEDIEPTIKPAIVRNKKIPTEDVEENSYNHYGSIIPEDMLEGESEQLPTDFSISFSSLTDTRNKEEKYGSK